MGKDWREMNRREFLAALGATYGSAACAYGAPRSWFVDYANGDSDRSTERLVNALCPMCPGGCGLQVRLVHGCAVGVRGNKNHPINRGGLCSRASAVLQDLYNPDRLQEPVRRMGERGSGRWEKISWDSAIDTMVERLNAVRQDPGPHGLCVVVGRNRGVMRDAWQRFTRAYGSPNLIDAFPQDNLGTDPAVLATHGIRERIGHDVASASFVLSFSSGWLDAHWSAEQSARAFADFRRGRPGFRPRWIHIEPRYSLTAAKADEWVPIRPGTEGVLALGIAHVVIREGLYDRDFVERHTHGFEDDVATDGTRRLGFRRMVLQDYTPATVQKLTGVPEGALFRLGREFGLSRPAVALGFDGDACAGLATMDRIAIHCLNALVGSIDVPGGITVFRELSLLVDDSEPDSVAERGLAAPRLDGSPAKRRLSESAVGLLTESLDSGEPYRPEILVLADADPVFSEAEGKRLGNGLSRVPFVAAFSGYHNDSTRYADLILPIPHGLLRWDFNTAHTLQGHPVVTVSRPIMAPPSGMPDTYDLLRSLAGRIGGSVEKALPFSSSQKVVDAVCQKLFETGRGATFGPANEESWAQLLESRGWRAPFAKDFGKFKRDMFNGGGWTDPIYYHREWDRVFRSPSKKFAFRSVYLDRSFEAIPEPDDSGSDDRRCLPDCRRSERERDRNDSLDLYVYVLPNLAGVSAPNLPWLNDIAGAYMFERWRTWVEIHPDTAGHYGIAEGDQVEVRTSRGTLVLAAKIFLGLRPDVIAVPFGFGRKAGGRWCTGIGENPAVLVDPRTDPLTGTKLWTSTPATIRKV